MAVCKAAAAADAAAADIAVGDPVDDAFDVVESRFIDFCVLFSKVRVSWVSNDERAVDLTDLLRTCGVAGAECVPVALAMTCFLGAKFNCQVNRFCLARLERLNGLVERLCGIMIGLGLRSSFINLMPLNSSNLLWIGYMKNSGVMIVLVYVLC